MDNNSLAHTKWECKYHIVFAVLKGKNISACFRMESFLKNGLSTFSGFSIDFIHFHWKDLPLFSLFVYIFPFPSWQASLPLLYLS